MSSKIFLGGLSGITTKEDLMKYFTKFGKVLKVKLPKKKINPKFSIGYGILKMSNNGATKIIIRQKDHIINGRTISAKPFLKGNSLKKLSNKFQNLRVFVKEIPKEFTNEDLYAIFSKIGKLKDCYIIFDLETKEPRGFGYVTFLRKKAARKAIATSEIIYKGKVLKVSEFISRKNRKPEESNSDAFNQENIEKASKNYNTMNVSHKDNLPALFQSGTKNMMSFCIHKSSNKYHKQHLLNKINDGNDKNLRFNIAVDDSSLIAINPRSFLKYENTRRGVKNFKNS